MARPSSASRVRCSRSSLRRRSSPVKAMKSSSNSTKIAGSSTKSFNSRITTCSIFWYRLSRRASLCSAQPSDADAISLSRRRAGWLPRLKKVLSSRATLSIGICIRPIRAFSESGRVRSSRMNSNSIDTRLMTSSSTWPTTRERPLLWLTRWSSWSTPSRTSNSAAPGPGKCCCRWESRRIRSLLEIGAAFSGVSRR